jgi:hypothetical protein
MSQFLALHMGRYLLVDPQKKDALFFPYYFRLIKSYDICTATKI